MSKIQKVAIIGTGVIGAGWIIRCLAHNKIVYAFDRDIKLKENLISEIKRTWPYVRKLFKKKKLNLKNFRYFTSMKETLGDADLIQECASENYALKTKLMSNISKYAKPNALILSSSSGLLPTKIYSKCKNPERAMIGHPFNPVYLLPLVELVGDPKTTERAAMVLSQLGMHPLRVRKEIDAHIADRLLEAVWREGLWLINDGIATTQEIDDAIRFGFGLRWAQMGMFETYRIAGGEAGMAHFIQQFGPALEWPWTKLMDVPELTDELINKIARQSDQQSGQYSIRELERIRDDNLVAMMRALKVKDWGAGSLLNQVDQALSLSADMPAMPTVLGDSVRTTHRVVPSSWVDYNGHMNDSHYGEVFSKASDVLLHGIGADQDYIAQGYSYFTVDLQISYLAECLAGEQITVFTSITLAEGKKLKLSHEMKNAQGDVCASCSQFLLHVDLKSRKSCPPLAAVAEALARLN